MTEKCERMIVLFFISEKRRSGIINMTYSCRVKFAMIYTEREKG